MTSAPELTIEESRRELAEQARRFDLEDIKSAEFRRLLLVARDEGVLAELLIAPRMIDAGRAILWNAVDCIGPTDAVILAEKIFRAMLAKIEPR